MADKKEEKKEVGSTARSYYLLVSLVSAGRVKDVVSLLVLKGYTIGPLASSETAYITNDRNMCTLTALRVTRTVKDDIESPRAVVINEIIDILKANDILFYSILLTEPIQCNWQVGNVIQKDKVPVVDVGPYRTAGALT